MWIFSGNRGVHCWVLDGAALALTNEERSKIVKICDFDSLTDVEKKFEGVITAALKNIFIDILKENDNFLLKHKPLLVAHIPNLIKQEFDKISSEIKSS